jgi:hypothetical protein
LQPLFPRIQCPSQFKADRRGEKNKTAKQIEQDDPRAKVGMPKTSEPEEKRTDVNPKYGDPGRTSGKAEGTEDFEREGNQSAFWARLNVPCHLGICFTNKTLY